MARNGYTLLEAVITLVILAIVAAIAVPKWYSSNALNLNSQLYQLASDVEYAQSHALNYDQTIVLTFNANNYVISTSSAGPTPTFPATMKNTVTLPTGFTLSSTANPITFTNIGQAPATNTVLTLSNGGSSKSLTITAQSGLVVLS